MNAPRVRPLLPPRAAERPPPTPTEHIEVVALDDRQSAGLACAVCGRPGPDGRMRPVYVPTELSTMLFACVDHGPEGVE